MTSRRYALLSGISTSARSQRVGSQAAIPPLGVCGTQVQVWAKAHHLRLSRLLSWASS